MKSFSPLITSFFLIFLAEISDKTQLVAISLATHYQVLPLILGIFLAAVFLQGMAVSLAEVARTILPVSALKIITAGLFTGAGLWLFFSRPSLRKEAKNKKTKWGPFLAAFIAFFLAEIGDKTQVGTLALATKFKNPGQVFFGATFGLCTSNYLGIFLGNLVSKKFHPQLIRKISALLFLAFGLITLTQAKI